MDNVAVDEFGMRHLSLGFRSNSLHLERKIALALTIPPEYRGKEENVMERRKRQRNEKELLTLQGTDERRTSVVE
jgi:hypothetical protein